MKLLRDIWLSLPMPSPIATSLSTHPVRDNGQGTPYQNYSPLPLDQSVQVPKAMAEHRNCLTAENGPPFLKHHNCVVLRARLVDSS